MPAAILPKDPFSGPLFLNAGQPVAKLGAPMAAEVPPVRFGTPCAFSGLTDAPKTMTAQYVPPGRRRDVDDLAGDDELPSTIQLNLPGAQRLFRLESEAGVRERIRQEARARRTPQDYEFPEELKPSRQEQVLVPRRWTPMTEQVEPGYVWHRRLLSEQINSARYGWDMGILQPAISAAHFYADVATFPYHLAQDPWRYGDTSAGKCLPGDPVPLLLYPPQPSASGTAGEAAALVPLFFAFP
jgi:hypothetical protein